MCLKLLPPADYGVVDVQQTVMALAALLPSRFTIQY